MKKLDWYNLDDRIKIIEKVAKEYNWIFICHQQDTCMLSYGKNNIRINVYYTKMTVSTSLKHPKKGKTQLFRKWVDEKLLKKIFNNPRLHTQSGYYEK